MKKLTKITLVLEEGIIQNITCIPGQIYVVEVTFVVVSVILNVAQIKILEIKKTV